MQTRCPDPPDAIDDGGHARRFPCQKCRKRVPTRFAVLMRTAGYVIASQWEIRADRLCDACLSQRFGTWSGSSAVLGWWGAMSFFRTVRALPSNLLEMRLAKATPPLPYEPTDEQVAAEAERVARRTLAFEALRTLPWGLLLAALGGSLVWGSFAEPAAGRSPLPAWMVVAGWVLGILGLLLALATFRARCTAFRAPLAPSSEGASVDGIAAMAGAAPAPQTEPPSAARPRERGSRRRRA